jgi:hypothetical protein
MDKLESFKRNKGLMLKIYISAAKKLRKDKKNFFSSRNKKKEKRALKN